MTSPSLDYAKVVGKVAVIVGDLTDPDENPDIVYADTGTVTFTPQIKAVQVAGPPAVLVGPQPITADISSSGQLTFKGLPEVYLLDLGSTKVNPTFDRNKGAYLVEFAGLQAGGVQFKLPSFYCNPAAGQTNDIALMMQFTTGASGQLMVVGPPGPGLAEGGAAGQVAAKASSADFDTTWIDPPAGVTDWTGLTGKPTTFAPIIGTSSTTAKRGDYQPASTDLTDATTVGRALIVAANAAAARTAIGAPAIDDATASGSAVFSSSKTNTAIAAAVAALVNSSPSTLDTLKELADALGDDPNFATTVATSLAGKAPVMTTTVEKTANYGVGANEIVPMNATSGALTVTLPNAPADKTRVTVKKIDSSANAVVVTCAGSDVYNKTGGGTSVSLALANQALTVQYDASRHVWTIVADDLPLTGGHIPIGAAHIGAAVFVVKSGANWQDLAGTTITTRPAGAQLMISISTDGTVPSFATAGDIALTVPS